MNTRTHALRRNSIALPSGFSLRGYEIEAILGRGGFGITYLAWDHNLRRKVAIKEYMPTFVGVNRHGDELAPSDPHQDGTYRWGLDCFLNEYRTLAMFSHPNIVSIHAAFEANNTAYMVMELLDGDDLENAYKFGRLKSEDELKFLVNGVLDALEPMHAANFIHRDIKPSNIFVRTDGTPILLDFGSSRWTLAQQLKPLTSFATRGYAAPEQYADDPENTKQGPWTDIYSLGATLYRGISGRDPVDAVSRINARLEGPDRLLPSVVLGEEKYSHEFLSAIDWALSLNVAHRPKSIDEWRNALEHGIDLSKEISPRRGQSIDQTRASFCTDENGPAYSAPLIDFNSPDISFNDDAVTLRGAFT